MLVLLAVLYLLDAHVRGIEICYDDLGCFSDAKPWSGTLQRPLAALPWSPETIDTHFFLYTRENLNNEEEINPKQSESIKKLSFQITRKTCFIIHGLAYRATDTLLEDICKEILRADDVNCIAVNWNKGSGDVFNYVQAANNVRVVGAQLAHLIKVFEQEDKDFASKVHLIGFSLGAHVAGEAGKRHYGIARISGLDPARPFFEDTPIEVRLDESDALFVDVIHTDSGSPIGVGMRKPVGHFDFYPNGGKQMPGCQSMPGSYSGNGIIQKLACNHMRAMHYYNESITNRYGFLGYPCDSYELFQSGWCFPCPAGGCPSMGYFARASREITSNSRYQTFYLNTGRNLYQFSSWRYKVSVMLSGKYAIPGSIFVSLSSTAGTTQEYEVVKDILFPGNTFSGFIDVEFELLNINQVYFKWSALFFNVFRQSLGAEQIDIQSGKDSSIFSFYSNAIIRDNIMQTLTP
ncbi:pancreatic lipase-related protein 2-like [Bombina bombina]|uniref:pancreatic lipase-related protein 2-like n=1 Tax=Bombina bombina TaxID=8345 RepID=UPI00235AC842|nr:pancreatic lipase-related protein 2-like [Bombina bombina]